MSNLLSVARKNAINAFLSNEPTNLSKRSFYTYTQRHDNDCITACFRFLSDVYNQEAPSDGLAFNDALMVAANFGLYLLPLQDLTLLPSNCIILGLTNDPRNHAYLIHRENGRVHAIYDPARGVVEKGTSCSTYDWTHLALVYKPSSLRDAD